jgi:hypothetical protein
LIAPRIPPSIDEERALLRCALRLLVGYTGGAAFVVGLLHLAGNVGATWHALALLTAGLAATAAGSARARSALRDADADAGAGCTRGARRRHHRQGRAYQPPMADQSLGRRVG